MKDFIFIITLILLGTTIQAQTVNEAVRYSTFYNGGTARVTGAGGSFGSMGGDFGVLTINPAGLGDYRSSELVLSTAYSNVNTTSLFQGNDVTIGKQDGEFALESIGMIFNKSRKREIVLENGLTTVVNDGKMVTSNWAIGLQQYNNYYQVFRYEIETEGSISDRFVDQANGGDFSLFEAGLAEEAGVVFFDDIDQAYFSDLLPEDVINKDQFVERSGKTNELIVAWGGKTRSGLNIGAGLGIPFIAFEENKSLVETDLVRPDEGFKQLSYTENLSTSGVGINLKLGVSYTLNKIIRLGLAYVTPTLYRLDDNFTTSIIYECEACILEPGEAPFVYLSPDGFNNYKLRIPSRTTASFGFLINRDRIKGFVNADIQYINYAGNKFKFDDSDADFEEELNGDINNQLNSSININLGGEIAVDRYRVRAGVGLIGSPFADGGADGSDQLLSGGLGYRANKFFIDASYQYRDFEEIYEPYQVLDTRNELQLTNTTDTGRIVVTLGIKI